MTSKRVSDTERHPYVVMKNGSNEPIYDGLCVVIPSTSLFASDPEAILEPGRPEDTTIEFGWADPAPSRDQRGSSAASTLDGALGRGDWTLLHR